MLGVRHVCNLATYLVEPTLLNVALGIRGVVRLNERELGVSTLTLKLNGDFTPLFF